MYCGTCGQENPVEHKFCSGCGKPLRSATATPSQNGRYSVILTTAPQDEFERFCLAKKIGQVLSITEQEAAAKLQEPPCVLVSLEDDAEVIRVKSELTNLGATVLVKPYGLEDLATINGNGEPTPPRTLPEGAVMAELQQLKASQTRLKAIALRLVGYGIGLVIICGLFRVYYGGGIGVKVVWKESFSFQDTVVNVDDIVGMPRIVVATKHPQVKRQLEDLGIVETEEQAKKRMWDEIDRDTQRLMGKYGLDRW